MSWTSEKVEKLKELWSKGHTASQIAQALGDTTRNAVIGKAHRLNLEARAPSKQSSSPKSPIGHPNEEKFYFCGRKPEGDFPYCKLHVLYAFQPKNQKEDDLGEEIPEFIEKKVKSAG